MSAALRRLLGGICSSARRALQLTEAGANYVPIVREAFDMLASGTCAFTWGDRGARLVLKCNMAFSVL